MKKTVYFFLFFLLSNFLIAQTIDFKKNKIKAEQGDAKAQFNVGHCYYKGDKK